MGRVIRLHYVVTSASVEWWSVTGVTQCTLSHTYGLIRMIIIKRRRKYVSNIPGNHEVKELQKTAILGTAHLLQKVVT